MHTQAKRPLSAARSNDARLDENTTSRDDNNHNNKQHSGMVVARRILRRRAAATAETQGSVAAELVGGTLSHTRARPRVGARVFILLWTAMLLLPEEAQARVAQRRRRRDGSGRASSHHRRPPSVLRRLARERCARVSAFGERSTRARMPHFLC